MAVADQLLENGYYVVRECVPPNELDSMRAHCEEMLERHKRWWAENRQPGEPSGGEWESGIQPRVLFDRVIDSDAHEILDLVFHHNIHDLCRKIMQTDDVAPTQFGMLCNPRRDRGPADWHRDISPPSHGPTEALFRDFVANPPCYMQWNIPLYDDDVLWIMPGSHRRFNTDAENHQLSNSEYEPLQGGQRIELAAGDGVVYLTPVLHWGSNYSTQHRRTLHFGYRAFGNGSLTHAFHMHWQPDITDFLPKPHGPRFGRFIELRDNEHNSMERLFRAMMTKDVITFDKELGVLHSGQKERMSCIVQLSKIALTIRNGRGQLAKRFDKDESALLWRRFAAFDHCLRLDKPALVPGYQMKEPSTYRFEEMPDMELAEFIASW